MSTSAPFLEASAGPRAVSLPVAFFERLRQAALSGAGTMSVDAVRDAGYQAGQALFDQFGPWLSARGEAGPMELADERFPGLFEAFFREQGWGHVQVTPLSEAVMLLDASEWGEALDPDGGCLVSTGVFAGFLGRLADAPLSVLEVDSGDTTPGRCRFLVGSVDVLEYVWDAMQRGVSYDRASQSAC
jgi:hypothetical protein